MSPIDSWINDLWCVPEEILPIIGAGRALWTAKELAVLYHGEGENELSPGKIKAVASSLRNRGFAQAHGGALVRRPGGAAERFWIIQQRDRVWDGPTAAAHLRTVA